MKRIFIGLLMMSVALICPAARVQAADGSLGEQAFKKNCVVCHPGGGNIINRTKTLHKASLSASGILSAADIVSTMRKPGPGMTQFDEKAIPDETARAIAEYVLKTFR